MEEQLKEHYLHIEQNEKPNKYPIDFEIKDKQGKLWAAVWGESVNDIEIECDHPAVEFDDDEHVGECVVCVAWTTWHWEKYNDDGYPCYERIVDSYIPQKEPGGIIKEYLKKLEQEGATC